MHLQENSLFDIDLVTQYPLHHVTYSAKWFEVATSNGLGGDTFTRFIHYLTFKVKVTRNFAQYLLHYVTYSATKFEVATSNGLGRVTFTRNVTDGRTDGWTDGHLRHQWLGLLSVLKWWFCCC